MLRASLPVVLVLFVTLGGCQFTLLSDAYSEQRVATINGYHKATVAFISAAEGAANTPAGAYSSETAKAFYSSQKAVIANLVLNAEIADRGRPCPSTFVAAMLPATQFSLSDNDSVGADAADSSSRAGCTVIVLRHLQHTHGVLEAVHKESRYLTPPTSTIVQGFIDDAVRIALQNEKAKN